MSGHPITVQGHPGFDYASIASPIGFTNAGTINLTSLGGGNNSDLYVTTGVPMNTGMINVEPGKGGFLNALQGLTLPRIMDPTA